jgi:scavenger receptor class B protein 1
VDGEGPESWCYCMKNLNYKCLRPGAMNLEPCGRDTGAPLVISFPHFLDADESYREAVDGLSPDKAKHQFFVDVEPRLGLPAALGPRFQLNLRLFPDAKTEQLRNIREDLVVPFLWAEEGFAEPSEKLSGDILRGLEAPRKWSTVAGSVLVVLGVLMIAGCATYFIWKCNAENEREDDDE